MLYSRDAFTIRAMTDKLQPQFTEILALIQTAQNYVIATSNQELLKLYWRIGEFENPCAEILYPIRCII
jgi:hypothetical protein